MNQRISELMNSLDFGKIGLNETDLVLSGPNENYVDLIGNQKNLDKFHEEMYHSNHSIEVYRNFLNWLFATFKTTEAEFRKNWIQYLNLKNGQRVLIISCGLGEDVTACAELVGAEGYIHAQDISRQFIQHAAEKFKQDNIIFTISDALDLPYHDNYFDAVCHFGGINLFGDIKKSIAEMTRVCKMGGSVLFGDESVAMHLRDLDYGKMFIKNNCLWEKPLPLEHLPNNANDITIKYILGNCFYLIGFEKATGLPDVDIDVKHLGYRGGSVRTRYFGQLEGISPELKAKIYDIAKANNVSVSHMLSEFIENL